MGFRFFKRRFYYEIKLIVENELIYLKAAIRAFKKNDKKRMV
jgi:hypothetical protein